jgi:hypothetical protein
MDLGYLIHDFAAICRTFKPYTRTVFIDMGASLDFHDNDNKYTNASHPDYNPFSNDHLLKTKISPAVYITDIYKKFGIKFDHIYGYEITSKDPMQVYERIPNELKSSYHWYNIGVNSSINSSSNPLKSILIDGNFNKDDFIVIKLDIDTNSIELPMSKLILDNPKITSLVDVFYFEHHVYMKDMAQFWRKSMGGTVKESLELFHNMRKKGIASHSWV